MILVNTEMIAGYKIVEVFGLVQGSTVRAKHVGRDFAASIKNLIGGELEGYTELLAESRYEATERMIEDAKDLGANAIVNVRFATSSVAAGAAELYAYGTAVRVAAEAPSSKPPPSPPPLPDGQPPNKTLTEETTDDGPA